jgi:cell pole-organizing protein PopZ
MPDDTLISLRRLIHDNDRRISDILNERDLRYQQRFEATAGEARVAAATAKNAVDKADRAIEKRFNITNEWRSSINDVISTRLSRDEYQSAHTALTEKLDDVTARILRVEGRSSGIGTSLGVILSVGALLISIIFGTLGIINIARTPPPVVQQIIPHDGR